jgi:pimeloyl-ACP methyl ester carboxylesterase
MTSEERLAKSLGIDFSIKQVSIGKHKINYLTAGKGDPLLLIHGANFGWGVWYPNIPELSKYFTIYAIDLPGAGRSSTLDYKKLDPNQDLVHVVDQFIILNQLENAHILGFSIGGWLALKIALLHPQRRIKLVVTNSVGFTNYMNFSQKVIGFYPLANLIANTILRPKRNNREVENFFRKILYNYNLPLRTDFIEYFYETMEASHSLLLISRLTALTDQLVLSKQLSSIQNKTLIIWGENDKIIPLEKNKEYFKYLPQSEIKIIHQTGHIPSLEEPKEFNRIILEFLSR